MGVIVLRFDNYTQQSDTPSMLLTGIHGQRSYLLGFFEGFGDIKVSRNNIYFVRTSIPPNGPMKVNRPVGYSSAG